MCVRERDDVMKRRSQEEEMYCISSVDCVKSISSFSVILHQIEKVFVWYDIR